MNKSKDFLEFVKNNPPPCLPDDKLYWFDDETGEIKQDKHCVGKIVLTSKWEWKIIDSDNGEIITPNENRFICITPEDAKKFRDKVESVKYVILRPDENGGVIINNLQYSYFKDGVLTQIDTLSIHEDYFSAIIKHNQDFETGMVVVFLNENSHILAEDGTFEECFMTLDKKTKRILEDVFEEDQ